MTIAPLSSTIVALGLIPVAFLFCHAFLSGRSKNRFHPVSGTIAISWDLILSIGYMLYRSFGGAVDGSTIKLTPTLDVYFGIHGAVAVLVMTLEVLVLAIGISMLRSKSSNSWHGKLTKILFGVWWFAFLTGEVFYIVMYVL
jgi:preprotein translocase subunit Sec61beta